jgi:predicted small lipoprotein YifL
MKTFLASVLLIAVAACGSSNKGPDKAPSPPTDGNAPTTPTTDGMDAAVPEVDGSSPAEMSEVDSGPKAPTNQAECVATCEAKYPKSAAQNKTLDSTCMLAGTCEPVCNDLIPGKNYEPTVNPDAGVVCDTAKADSYPILTPSAACSTCLASSPVCCNLWIAIFSSTEGKALNACANTCYSSFKN